MAGAWAEMAWSERRSWRSYLMPPIILLQVSHHAVTVSQSVPKVSPQTLTHSLTHSLTYAQEAKAKCTECTPARKRLVSFSLLTSRSPPSPIVILARPFCHSPRSSLDFPRCPGTFPLACHQCHRVCLGSRRVRDPASFPSQASQPASRQSFTHLVYSCAAAHFWISPRRVLPRPLAQPLLDCPLFSLPPLLLPRPSLPARLTSVAFVAATAEQATLPPPLWPPSSDRLDAPHHCSRPVRSSRGASNNAVAVSLSRAPTHLILLRPVMS